MCFSDYSIKQKAIWLSVWSVSWGLGYGVTDLVLWLLGLGAYDWADILVGCIAASIVSYRLEHYFDGKERKKFHEEYGKHFGDNDI